MWVNQGDNEGVDSVSMTELASADLPARLPALLRRGKYNKTQQLPFSRHEQGASRRNAAERGLRKIDCNRRVRSTSGEAALPPPQGDFLENRRRRRLFFMKQRCSGATTSVEVLTGLARRSLRMAAAVNRKHSPVHNTSACQATCAAPDAPAMPR